MFQHLIRTMTSHSYQKHLSREFRSSVCSVFVTTANNEMHYQRTAVKSI
uniref:Uncharacterized protein n=1 Tax=Arundo donax TaxID=35708 RepID=A0A0A9G936_ARUDO